ncbi:hypothetical protein JOB18_011837 [Solea senegalensis]|uniref:Uncharacterized protein n=1 Tax=Solea senegalensis TaxID=28829 RepID=A0AAV6R466_SOLSE|nr:hypothetical protein JOB18_011837 [Solea senegalensis]
MKTASRAQARSSPPLVQMRRYTPGLYPFLFPSVISSLPQLPRPSHQRLQIQQPSSSGSTPSPVGEYCLRFYSFHGFVDNGLFQSEPNQAQNYTDQTD